MGGPKDYLIRRRQHGKAGGGSTHVGTLLYSYVYIVVVYQSDDVVENPTCVCREGRILFGGGKRRKSLTIIRQSIVVVQ